MELKLETFELLSRNSGWRLTYTVVTDLKLYVFMVAHRQWLTCVTYTFAHTRKFSGKKGNEELFTPPLPFSVFLSIKNQFFKNSVIHIYIYILVFVIIDTKNRQESRISIFIIYLIAFGIWISKNWHRWLVCQKLFFFCEENGFWRLASTLTLAIQIEVAVQYFSVLFNDKN